MARISLSPLIGYTIVMDMKDVALLGCIVGAFSDWLDGYIAKNYNQKVFVDQYLTKIEVFVEYMGRYY